MGNYVPDQMEKVNQAKNKLKSTHPDFWNMIQSKAGDRTNSGPYQHKDLGTLYHGQYNNG